VYAYPSEHYAFWRTELPGTELPWGMFGDNFSTEDCWNRNVQIGDRLRAGSAIQSSRQPRMPCFKLGISLWRPDMVKRFQRSGRPASILRSFKRENVAPVTRLSSSPRDTHGITWRISPTCSWQMRRTRTSCAAATICPHFRKAAGVLPRATLEPDA